MDIYSELLRSDEASDASYDMFTLRDVNLLSGARKIRIIGNPNSAMRRLQRRLVEYLREMSSQMPYATACLPGTSIERDVCQHRKSRLIYVTDIEHAFPSVRIEPLTDVLWNGDPSRPAKDNVRQFLEHFCFDERTEGLVLGSPSSPDLFNLYAGLTFDCEIGELLNGPYRHLAITYTRYLDDLKVSTVEEIGDCVWKELRQDIRRATERAGFQVSHKKSKVLDLRKAPVVLNGIGLEYGGRMYLPRGYLRETRRIIDEALADPSVVDKRQVLSVTGRMQKFFQIIESNDGKVNGTENALLDRFNCFRRQFGY